MTPTIGSYIEDRRESGVDTVPPGHIPSIELVLVHNGKSTLEIRGVEQPRVILSIDVSRRDELLASSRAPVFVEPGVRDVADFGLLLNERVFLVDEIKIDLAECESARVLEHE